MVTPLSDICARAIKYGVQAAAPVPKPNRPHLPFKVIRSTANPGSRYATLGWERTRELRTATLARNDLILHLPTRVVARVVERLKPDVIRIEAWCQPETPETMQAWLATCGKGNWVCWGQCWETIRETPKCMVPATLTNDWEFFARDVHRYPEKAMSMMDRDKRNIRRPWKGMSRKKRQAARRRWRQVLGKVNKVRDMSPDALDLYADKHAIASKKRKEGGVEVTKFVLGGDED